MSGPSKQDRYLASLFSTLFEGFCEGDWEIEIHDLITEGAVAAGLVECVDFDPEEHTDNGECEPGDPFYQITAAGRAVLQTARASDILAAAPGESA
jgi:hypothetical protein